MPGLIAPASRSAAATIEQHAESCLEWCGVCACADKLNAASIAIASNRVFIVVGPLWGIAHSGYFSWGLGDGSAVSANSGGSWSTGSSFPTQVKSGLNGAPASHLYKGTPFPANHNLLGTEVSNSRPFEIRSGPVVEQSAVRSPLKPKAQRAPDLPTHGVLTLVFIHSLICSAWIPPRGIRTK